MEEISTNTFTTMHTQQSKKNNAVVQNPVEVKKEKELSKGAKVAIGAGLAALAVAGIYLVSKGRVKDVSNGVKNTIIDAEKKIVENGEKTAPKAEVKVVEADAKEKAVAEAKAKAVAEAKAKAEAEAKAEKDLKLFSEKVPTLSRSDIAQQRYELNRWGGDIDKLQRKAKQEGLTELENVKLDFLCRKLTLLENQEKAIAKSLEKFKPTVSEKSAVTMHHGLNGENSNIRTAISHMSQNPNDLTELQLKNIEGVKKRIAKIDSEFAQLPPLEKDCIVYRGRGENPLFKRQNADFEIMEKANVGDVVVPDTAYSYTAFNYDMANNWCQGGRCTDINNNPLRTIMYEIHLPKGAKVSRNLEHGGEVVMPRGAQYKVVDKKVHDNGDIEAVLEYILPKSN